MRLKHFYIKDYKNLKDFSLDFENGNGLSILIGNNGSGKSNVLEAISKMSA
ncbi:MAG: AAA family ATPase [Treponema sp.]|nr:AAA family ATPase [Treponema sp.]